MRKIVAIGGGENGRILEDGTNADYETFEIDKEIVRLTNKEKPNFLFICHSFSFSKEIQDSYYDTMKKIYGDIFGCNCKHLRSDELDNIEKVKKKVEWADIIYEGGGDTDSMIKLWKKTKFDKILYKSWNDGKVICGISAGAVCWFNSCNSDVDDSNTNFEVVKCLDWFNLFVTPHVNEKGRLESTKEQLKNNKMIGLLMSNRSAIEIIDDKYKIISSKFSKKGLKKPYIIKAYWDDNNNFIEQKLTNEIKFKNVNSLFVKD
jgi:dipeptidase E